MAVGAQPTVAGLNQSLTSAAQEMRNTMQAVANFTLQVQNLGTGGLTGLGFSSGDAASMLQYAGYLNTLVGCYQGTVQQGGSGGTGAILFNFQNALSAVWAGG
jgi:hypothetical protein